MKKVSLVVLLSISLLNPSDAFGAVKSGTSCKPLNSVKISNGMKYTCVKSKGKLVWNKGVAVTKPVASPTPSAEVSSSPTPAPSAMPSSESVSPTPTSTAVVVKDVTAGAFCAPAGASGLTKTGLPVTCKTSATDTRNRWRQ